MRQIRLFTKPSMGISLGLFALFLMMNLAVAFATPAENAEIKKALDNWVVAVTSGNAQAVADLYTEDSILIPTLSNKLKDSPEKKLKYFKKFTALPKLQCKIVSLYSRVYGDIGVNSGTYDFEYEKNGKIIKVPARFSFVYHKTDKGWLIVDHQSSKMPE